MLKIWSFRVTDIFGGTIIVVGTQNLAPGHIYYIPISRSTVSFCTYVEVSESGCGKPDEDK